MKSPKRTLAIVASIVAMLGPGSVYSYSLFAGSLAASFHWTAVETTWGFALSQFFLGLGAVFGGLLVRNFGPRRVALFGALVWGLGNVATGTLTQSVGAPAFYLSYGVIGGLGIGMVYIAGLTVASRWFPHRRGFGTGLVVMGFGLGAFVYNTILKLTPQFREILTATAAVTKANSAAGSDAAHVLAPAMVHALMSLFTTSGIFFFAIGAIVSLFMATPPADYVPPGQKVPVALPVVTPAQMLATPQFYLLWIMLFLNVTAGAVVVSNAVGLMHELSGITPIEAGSWYAGLAIFNGLGRFFWGALSDRIGRRLAFALIFGIQVFAFVTLGSLSDMVMIAPVIAIVLLCYGGGFGVMPSMTSDYFGNEYFPINYGLVVTAWGCAGVVGPSFASAIKDLTGSVSGALVPMAIVLLVGILFPIISERAAPVRRASGSAAAPAA
ncbi:MAG: OFA family MFS transporter [Vulcanimicrobiaceae bacterium]